MSLPISAVLFSNTAASTVKSAPSATYMAPPLAALPFKSVMLSKTTFLAVTLNIRLLLPIIAYPLALILIGLEIKTPSSKLPSSTSGVYVKSYGKFKSPVALFICFCKSVKVPMISLTILVLVFKLFSLALAVSTT